jgi:glycerate kinase
MYAAANDDIGGVWNEESRGTGDAMMNQPVATVLVAPTAFKGTLGPEQAAQAMAAGVTAVWPAAEILQCPLSDGGNGLLEAYVALEGGAMEAIEVSGPVGDRTTARYVRSGSTVVIESAEACGLHLVPRGRLDPLHSTTRGVGELLLAAVAVGASEVILGLGGSATVDGGTGMAKALGWGFSGAAGTPLGEGGGPLARLRRIDAPSQRFAAPVMALCDVQNLLTGPRGAAVVYGPQKGARPEDVQQLELGLERLAALIRLDLGIEVAELPGAGAAGGLGAGARAFLGADLVAGSEWMLRRGNLREILSGADLLVTGEGRFDAQSGMGKVTGRLLEAARLAGVPALLVCGRVDGSTPPGVVAVHDPGRTLSSEDVARLAEDACRALARGGRL